MLCNVSSLVDGEWSPWSSFGSCTATCDGGVKTRTRTCTNPEPQDGGDDCEGPSEDERECGTKACKGEFKVNDTQR